MKRSISLMIILKITLLFCIVCSIIPSQQKVQTNNLSNNSTGNSPNEINNKSLQQQNNHTNLTQPYNLDEKSQIFGVRWFLGDHFQFSYPKSQSQEMFILMFNSREDLDDQIYIKMQGSRYGCYQRFLEIQSVGQHHYQHNVNASKPGDSFLNYLYKCVIGKREFKQPEIAYQIIAGWVIFQGKKDKTVVSRYKEDILFQGKLRIPQNIQALQIYFVADWGLISNSAQRNKGYKPIMPAMVKQLNDNKNLGLIIFGGDLAYDLQTQNYINMLTYMQPLTSCMLMLVTPGNHESVYHQDSFQLFVQSFYTPMWYKYFNYFSVSVLQFQKTIILSYDPQNSIFPLINRVNQNLSQIFQHQLNKTITSYIKENYDVIVFSHYPIYCSYPNQHLQACDNNQQRFDKFIKKFKEMGMDLYLSGHLHIYQRTKQICNQKLYHENQNHLYDKSCPIYVVEGDAGNQDYVAMKQEYPLKNYSQVQTFGTGYSILKLQKRNLTWSHYNIKQSAQTILTDEFTIYQPQQQNNKLSNQIKNNLIMVISVTLIILLILLVFRLLHRYNILRLFKRSFDSKQQMQMNEQNFQTPPNNYQKGKTSNLSIS